MSPVETIKAAYAAFGRNDPSVLFAAMDSGITWNEAEGNPLADRNPYVGAQAIGEGVFGRLLGAIDGFSAVPVTFIDGTDDVVVLGRYGGTMKNDGARLDAQFCHVYRFRDGKVVSFQQVHRLGAVGPPDALRRERRQRRRARRSPRRPQEHQPLPDGLGHADDHAARQAPIQIGTEHGFQIRLLGFSHHLGGGHGESRVARAHIAVGRGRARLVQ